MFSQCHVVEKIFQNLCVRLKLSIRKALKRKMFVTCEIQYFELGIFSFSSYIYCLSCGFIASTRAFNRATHSFSLLTHGFELVIRNLSTNCLSVFDHFVKLALKGLLMKKFFSEISFLLIPIQGGWGILPGQAFFK